MSSKTTLPGPVFILFAVAAFLAITPMLFFGNVWGYDFDIHLPAWIDVAHQLRQGVLFPRWDASANAGFGEPFFVFYPPLSWGLGGVLGSILPWKLVPGAYVWVTLLLAGTAMWKFARDWLDPRSALMAGLLYALNPYIVVMVYKRCSYGELLASAFFPLLLWAALRLGRDGRTAMLQLAIIFAAIWLADLPAGVIAGYSLVLLLAVASFVSRSLGPLLYGGGGILAAFAGIAFFLVPAAWERRWVNMGLVIRSDLAPESNFLFSHNDNPVMRLFSSGISIVGLLLVIATVVALLLAFRMRRDAPDVWYQLAALAVASAFLMFRPSLILWQILPQLRYVQFPWRWLSPLCAVGAIMASSAAAQIANKWLPGAIAALAIGAIGAATVYSVRWDAGHRRMNELVAAVSSDAGYTEGGTEWCHPIGSDPSKLPGDAPRIASAAPEDGSSTYGAGVQIQVRQWAAERKVFSVDSPRALRLKIKLLNYPGWQARLNGGIVPLETAHETGQMLLAVPAGQTRAEITFGRTPDQVAGDAISLTTVAAIVPLMWFSGRKRRRLADRG